MDAEMNLQARLAQLERENRKLRRENAHLQNAIRQEKLASTTLLNQQKANTWLIRERERYLALLLANSPSIILFLNQTGRIEFCTDYFIRKAGFKDVTEVQGHTLADIFSGFLDEASQKLLLKHSNAVIRTNLPVSFHVTFSFHQDNTTEDFDGLLVPMTDEEQHNNGLLLMFHDITALKRSREEALAASRAKSDFLSNMSHEIRTPMNAIIGMTAIGKEEADPVRKDYAFEKIESASTHLLGIINDILDISKIESGKMELAPIDFNFNQVIDRTMTVIALKIKNKRQHFSINIDPEIPEILYGDDQRLAQVITNILSNATKFTPEGGMITLTARLLNRQDNACRIQIDVRDSGIGISRQEQRKLFNIFQQAEAGTARKYGGSGLGLALSRQILALMEGEIWVASEPGSGSCFSFTAALGIPEQTRAIADSKSNSGGDSAGEPPPAADFTGKVILLADDMEINLEIVRALLKPTNITIDTVTSGKEAVDAFMARPGRYDLIFMDVQMPEIDGLQAARMIRELNTPEAAAVPILAMTANVFKEDIEKCLAAGMNGHLGKPIVIRDVIHALNKNIPKD